MMLDEAERSLHDALCVIRCLVKKQALIAGMMIDEAFEHICICIRFATCPTFCFQSMNILQEAAHQRWRLPYTCDNLRSNGMVRSSTVGE